MILLACFITSLVNPAASQVLNQDAEGKSSLIWSGGTIGVNVPDGVLKFNYFSSTNKNKGLLWGVDLQGENSSGIAVLFSEKEFSPKTAVSGLIGGYLSPIIYSNSTNKKEVEKDERTKISLQKKKDSLSSICDIIYSRLKEKWFFSLDREIRTRLIKDFNPIRITPEKMIENRDSIIQQYKKEDQFQNIKTNLNLLADDLEKNDTIKTFIETIKKNDENAKELNILLQKSVKSTCKIKYYFRAGLNVQEFKYDYGKDSTSIATRFADTVFLGPYGEIGASTRLGNCYLGIAFGYSKINNFLKLTKSNYKFSSKDTTIHDGSLEKTKDITAYTGNYGILNQFYINVDFMYMLHLLQESNYLGLGAYLRNNITSNIDLLPGNTVFGIGGYFIDGKSGKFLGGVYLQSDDISGRMRKDFGNSISFGLILKFAFSSIFLNE